MASLNALASTITKESNRLAAYIDEHHLPNPSFDVNGPPIFPVPLEDEDLQKSRMTLIRAAQDLATLALGPAESLRWQAWNVCGRPSPMVFLLTPYLAPSVLTPKTRRG